MQVILEGLMCLWVCFTIQNPKIFLSTYLILNWIFVQLIFNFTFVSNNTNSIGAINKEL